ncbi:D-3-phosphoglycerate dehydrogenase [gamma proteobacterium HdN1]|nr:D-3-phosphoglycerate dehydrogenase [gamma proteobacterium HdN1]
MSKHSLDKSKIRILLLEGVSQLAVENFERNGYTNIEYHKAALPLEDLKKSIAEAHFVGLRSRTKLTEEVFAAAQKLMAVGCFCIGTNQVDLNAATVRGIPVFNAPYSNTRSVAELVLAEAILLLRGIPEKNAKAHRGEWDKSATNSFEIRGKTLGIIGYGNIGSQLSVLAEALGMHVIFFDVVSKLPLGNASQVHTMDELFQRSDVVSLHVPDVPSTRNMIGKAHFDLMKETAIFINASRGTVVDLDALAQAVRDKKMIGAAIDVFPVEPRNNQEEFVSPLREFDNIILTPHIGGSTIEAQENIGLEVSEKFVKYSDNGTTISSVNFPEVSLAGHANVHRLLHIHKNVPGVMSAINRVFSENNINIAGQYLRTNDKIGYVVIEVEAGSSEVALQKLREVEGTIRTRVLF